MNNLQVIEFKNQRILTTKQLAKVYEVDEIRIHQGFNRNESKFIKGKHYYKLVGEELRDFKANYLKDSNLKYASELVLWTERGANRHCKILDTDEAWKQFDNLEETYFKVKNNMLEGVSKELQAIIMHDKKIQEVNTRVDKLENNMTIDTRQQNMLSKAGRKRIIGLLGGKNSLAYKNLSSKAFSALWHEYKDYFELGSYKDTPSIKFDEGLEFVTDWNLTNELRMEIKRLGNKEIA